MSPLVKRRRVGPPEGGNVSPSYHNNGVHLLGSLSEEVILHIFAYLDASELLQSSQLVNKTWYRLANDQTIWKSMYMSRFHDAPRVSRRLLKLNQLKGSSSLRFDRTSRRVSGGFQSDSTALSNYDWKKMYKIAHNWDVGTAETSSLPESECNLSSSPTPCDGSYSLYDSVLKFSRRFLFKAVRSAWSFYPSVQVWRLGDKQGEHILETTISSPKLEANIQGSEHSSVDITVIEYDDVEECPRLLIGYSNGAFSLFQLEQGEKVEFNEIIYSYSHMTGTIYQKHAVQAASIGGGIVIILNSQFCVSIYHLFEKGSNISVELIHELKSYVCWNPVRLIVSENDKEASTWRLTIVYASPIYREWWTVSAQEIFFTKTSIITSRLASPTSSIFRKYFDMDPLPDITASSEISSLCLALPHVLTAHKDNTIRVYHLTSSNLSSSSSPILKYKVTLYGHTGSVECLAADAGLGRFISGGSDGTLRIWELLMDKRNLRANTYNYTHVSVRATDSTATGRDTPVIKWVGFDEIHVVGMITFRDEVNSRQSSSSVRLWNFE